MRISLDLDSTNVIRRVLSLRKRMGIGKELSLADSRDGAFFQSQSSTLEDSTKAKINPPGVHDNIGWLAWEEDDPEP